MNKIGRPDKAGNDARQLLIDAARKKFVSKSYDKVSIRELAQAAGVNSAMIKYYFQNKEGLYKAMIMEVTGQIMNSLGEHLKSSNLDNIDDFFRSFVEVIKESPEFPLLMLKEVILNQGVCRNYFIEQLGSKHMKVFDQVFLRFKQAGKLRPDVDPLFFRMSLMGLIFFPWYQRELMGMMEGITFDDIFLERLIKHNSNLMQFGLFKADCAKDSIDKCVSSNLGESNA